MFLTTKLCTFDKKNCLNRNVYVYKIDFALNNLQWFICNKKKTKNKQTNKQIILC